MKTHRKSSIIKAYRSMKTYPIKSQTHLRKLFWELYPEWKKQHWTSKKRQNNYPADIRMAWVEYVDTMCRNGCISEKLADKATL